MEWIGDIDDDISASAQEADKVAVAEIIRTGRIIGVENLVVNFGADLARY